ncbi:uncharacterized protein PAC_20206 [Phialocephala subalpina]|uniref:Rhodopsin domain-containing protein n=1 Tax=Phialocephala subalpina TaxID=576137 RepID=A0A1L7XZ09_9HELO|nr:uncharacterized protein PAC_20206 [Phialocephala subalpina]
MAIESLQPLCYTVITIAFVIGTASIFLRLYTRAVIMNLFGWDDGVALLLLVLKFSFEKWNLAVRFAEANDECYYRHIQFLNATQVENIIKLLTADEVFYMFTHWTIKQAFLSFYLRLSTSPRFRLVVFATMGLNLTFMIINWCLAFFQCIPFDAIIHKAAHPNAKCIPELATLFVPSVLNIISDLIILAIPIVTIWGLQMSTRRKIAVISVVGFGASAVIIAACRLIILYQLYINPDISYVLGRMIIVAGLEIEFAIVAVNLPSMKALYTKMVGGSSGGSGEVSGAYKLSSFERRTGGPYKSSGKQSGIQSVVGTSKRGADIHNESDEALFDYGGQIKVTTKLDISSSVRGNTSDGQPEYHNFGNLTV